MHKRGQFAVFGFLYSATLLFLVIYSYVHVDLNLTLSSNPIYQSVQVQLTQIGYFQRPVSTFLFCIIGSSLLVEYLLFVRLAKQKKLSSGFVWKMIGATFILLLAYPAFSHDIFNYLFDGRIVTQYGLDPHYFKALDFIGDPWVRFMRWTHRYYPYGPGWLFVSLLPSYAGMGKFVLTLALFKVMFGFFHAANCWLIYRIAQRLNSALAIAALVFFAFNPLILIESLVSPHNEVMMLTGALASIWLLSKGKKVGALLLLIGSASIKYVSAILFVFLPWWNETRVAFIIRWAWWWWFAAVLGLVWLREPYSWYMLPLVGLAAISDGIKRWSVMVGISVGTTLRYIPFLYFGEYTQQTANLQNILLLLGFLSMSMVSYLVWYREKH